MDMQQGVPCALLPSYDVLRTAVNNCIMYYECVSEFFPLLSGMHITYFLECVMLSSVVRLAVQVFPHYLLNGVIKKKITYCVF